MEDLSRLELSMNFKCKQCIAGGLVTLFAVHPLCCSHRDEHSPCEESPHVPHAAHQPFIADYGYTIVGSGTATDATNPAWAEDLGPDPLRPEQRIYGFKLPGEEEEA